MYEHLIVKEQGRWVEVHLNRPQVRHALSRALMREITAVARALSDRTDIDVVILTGDARCFSAGADLNDAQAWADDSGETAGGNSIEVYIHRLRRKLEDAGLVIRTVRGLGYLLETSN